MTGTASPLRMGTVEWALLSLLAAISQAGNTGRNVYRIAVFPREVRVRALAYMRSARNVGYTLGALAGGIALDAGDEVIVSGSTANSSWLLPTTSGAFDRSHNGLLDVFVTGAKP